MYREAAKRSKAQANKARNERNERARVRAQKKEEENRKKKEEENRKKKEEAKAKRQAEENQANKDAANTQRKVEFKGVYNKAIQNLRDIKRSEISSENKLKAGKQVFRIAAMKLHPNKGGNNKIFQNFSSFYNNFKEM